MSSKTRYVCQDCGASAPKWSGRCSQCNAWNALVEESLPEKGGGFAGSEGRPSLNAGGEPLPFSRILAEEEPKRLSSGFKEFDRVLGGGIAPGAFILAGGAPGVGKSTLLLQTASRLASLRKTVLYVSAEESAKQSALRAKRLGAGGENLLFFSESSLESVLNRCEKIKPSVLVVDSIQTIFLPFLSSAPGTVSQVRECAGRLMSFAKSQNCAVFAVGHITKDGALAGPKVLEHLVDTALSFEGDNHYQFRILRSLKNRFGPSDESAVFEMSEDGLKEAADPSEFFLRETSEDRTGSAVFVALEGSRPFLCEIQSLTVPSFLAVPRRREAGLDLNRIHITAAVLDKYMGSDLGRRDLFVNLAGGLRIEDPAADFAVAVSVLSSLHQKPLPARSCFFGEVGLSGELRAARFPRKRVLEAERLGFKEIYAPASIKEALKGLKLSARIHPTARLQDLQLFQ